MVSNSFLAWVGFFCMLEWGLIHIFAGGITFYSAYKPDIPALLNGICDGASEAVKQEASQVTSWNAMNVRILIQHGLNLLWVGVWATGIATVLVTNRSSVPKSLFVMCIWPMLADFAYFWAIDLVHYGNPITESQTIIVSIATLCIVCLSKRSTRKAGKISRSGRM